MRVERSGRMNQEDEKQEERREREWQREKSYCFYRAFLPVGHSQQKRHKCLSNETIICSKRRKRLGKKLKS